MSIIRIKRSGTSGSPSTLATGELAYSWYDAGDNNQTSGGLRLYVGTGVDANTGLAASIDVIGGEYFTNKLDHTPGILVANSAIIVDSNKQINELLIDKIHIDDTTIGINANTTYAAANTDLTITAGSAGKIILTSNTVFNGTIDFNAQVTAASLNVEDLTNDRIVIAGTSGELEDDANFTFNGTQLNVGQGNFTVQQGSGNIFAAGTAGINGNVRIGANNVSNFTVSSTTGNTLTEGTLTVRGNVDIGASNQVTVNSTNGNTQIKGTLDVDGQSTLASLNVEDLTATRVVYVGAGGELVDDSGLAYTGAGANATLTVAGTLDVNTEALIATLVVEDLTDNRIVIAGTGGEIEDDANFTFDGTTFNIGSTGEFTVQVASGDTQVKGTLDVDGQATLASLNVQDLTAGRVTFAGTSGELVDSGNFIYTTGNNTLSLTGTEIITGDLQVDNLALDGNTLSSTDTDGNILLDPNGDGYVQAVGTNGFVIPVGDTSQQGPSVAGAIRFNSEINQFEGYSGVNWSSLGGVRSVDGLTYIIAESSPGSSDDILHFYAATSNTTTNEVAQLDDVSLRILNGTSSSNTTTGSLVVTGGAGISENLNIGGNADIDGDLNVDGGDITTNQTTFNVINTNATTVNAFGAATAVNIGTGGEGGGLTTIGHDLLVNGDFTVGANAFFVDHATGDTLVGRDLTVTGDLTVNGNTTTINVSTLEVEDALIYLAANNTTADSVDIGFAGNFFDASANTVMITGLVRDSGTKQWYLFDEYQDPDIDDNNIDISSNTFSKGILNTDRVNFSNTTIELTGDVAGTITIDHVGGGDGESNTVYTIATTVQADSVALGTDTTGDYVATIAEGATVDPVTAGSNTQNAIHITGTGEGAAVTVAAVLADHSGQLGVATFDGLSNGAGSDRNFDVSNTGSVSISAIDGGTY